MTKEEIEQKVERLRELHDEFAEMSMEVEELCTDVENGLSEHNLCDMLIIDLRRNSTMNPSATDLVRTMRKQVRLMCDLEKSS